MSAKIVRNNKNAKNLLSRTEQMDLKTVDSKLDCRINQNQEDWYQDLKLIYDNVILYNMEGTDINVKAFDMI